MSATSMWSAKSHKNTSYEPNRVQCIYKSLANGNADPVYLADTKYLDHLWQYYNEGSSSAHLLSIAIIFNGCNQYRQETFLQLASMDTSKLKSLLSKSLEIQPDLLKFLTNLVLLMPHTDALRKLMGPLFSISCWRNVDHSKMVKLYGLEQLYDQQIKSFDDRTSTWFYKLTKENSTEAYQLIATIISYLPTRRFTNPLLKEINYLSKDIPLEFSHWFDYLINYSIDINGDPTESNRNDAVIRFLCKAKQLDILTKCDDPFKLATSLDEFKQCLIGASRYQLTELATAVGVSIYEEDPTKDIIISHLWHSLAIDTTRLGLPEPMPTCYVDTPGFFDNQDLLYRAQHLAHALLANAVVPFYTKVKQRLSESGSSKFATELKQPPTVLGRSTSLVPGIRLEFNTPFEVRKDDLVYLFNMEGLVVPALVVSVGPKTVVTVEAKADFSKIDHVLRLNDELSGSFLHYRKLLTIRGQLPEWLMDEFANLSKEPLDGPAEVIKDASIQLTGVGGTVRKKVKTQSGGVSKAESQLIDIDSEMAEPVRLLDEPAPLITLDESQSQALLGALHMGLTTINGVMNSGKSYLAVSLLRILTRTFPDQRVLVIVGNEQRSWDHCPGYDELIEMVNEIARRLELKPVTSYNSAVPVYYELQKRWNSYLGGDKYPFDTDDVIKDYNSKVQLFRELKKLRYRDHIKKPSKVASNVVVSSVDDLLLSKTGAFDSVIVLDSEIIDWTDLLYTDCHQLKRLVLLGNRLLGSHSIMDRLYARPFKLALQYQARAAIAKLGRVDAKLKRSIKAANPVLAHTCQFLNVNGSEVERSDQYQNVAEAEYIVHLCMLMRLVGYPISDVGIITTSKLQQILISEVWKTEVEDEQDILQPLPQIYSVQDLQSRKFKYLLVSLVRTRKAQLQETKLARLFANSATHGLYIAGLANSYLEGPFKSLIKQGTRLQLVEDESYSNCSRLEKDSPETTEIANSYKLQGYLHMKYGL